MIWLLVLVVCGAIVVFGPSWIEAQEHITLADLLEQVTGQEYLDSNVNVTTAKHEHSPSHSAVLSQPLLTFYSYGDRFVKFLATPPKKQSEPVKNAFTVLMSSQRADQLPNRYI